MAERTQVTPNMPLTSIDSIRAKIEERLTAALSITHLSVVDESMHHQGHKESPGHAGSHLKLCIVSADFQHKPPIERHRLIYATLGDLMGTTIHALHIHAKTPDEWSKEENNHV